MDVFFAREPSKDERQRIEERIPIPLRDSIDWDGQGLSVGSDQMAHISIDTSYEDTEEDSDEYQGDGRFHFAKENQVTKFNADIEEWLRFSNGVVPIVAAFRGEDSESGGTGLSAWHAWSVQQTASVFEKLAKAKTKSTYAIRGILGYAEEAGLELTPAQRALLQEDE